MLEKSTPMLFLFIICLIYLCIKNIDINYYSGNVQLLVVSNEGMTCVNENYTSSGCLTIIEDLAQLNNGTYSITIILQSGDAYLGSFRIE